MDVKSLIDNPAVDTRDAKIFREARHFMMNWKDGGPTGDAVRVMISHWDMDGYGAYLIQQYLWIERPKVLYIEAKTPALIPKALETSKEFQDILETIGDRTLYILVTDLCPDPEIFRELQSKGIRVVYQVVDHHNNFHNYGVNDPNYLVYNNDTMSATEILWHLCETIALPKFQEDCVKVVEAISRYDTGHWGKWGDSIDNDDQSVIFELLFAGFLKEKNPMGWVRTMDDYIQNIMDRSLDRRKSEAYNDLLYEYETFIETMKDIDDLDYEEPFTMRVNIFGEIKNIHFPKPCIMGRIETKDDPLQIRFFSLISRRVLEENPNIDVLFLINENRGTMELRSSGGYNVGKIAHLNGGGGHARAAGFPLLREGENQ